MAIGKDPIGSDDGARQILRIPRERFAPGAIGASYQDVVEFMKSRQTDQTMGAYLMEFGVLRGKAGARMAMGSGIPDESVSILCMRHAA